MKLKNLFYLIHRDWIIGHGSSALSNKDKAEQILLQSGVSLQESACGWGVNLPEFRLSWWGQLPGITYIQKIPGGVNLQEQGVNQKWNGGSKETGIVTNKATRHFIVLVGRGYDNIAKKKYYRFIDVGRSEENRDEAVSENNKLFVIDKERVLRGTYNGKTYTLTEIRDDY
jgi:hypothetical protein